VVHDKDYSKSKSFLSRKTDMMSLLCKDAHSDSKRIMGYKEAR
jgi:hypothetical protein